MDQEYEMRVKFGSAIRNESLKANTETSIDAEKRVRGFKKTISQY